MGRAASYEFELRRRGAQRVDRLAPRLQGTEVKPRLRQHKLVLAAEIARAASEQSLPGQRLRMAVESLGHGGVECFQLTVPGRKIRIVMRHPFAEQSKRGKQTARGGIRGELSQEGLCINGPFKKVRELR